MISTGMSSVAKSKAVSLPQSGINIALEKPSSLKWPDVSEEVVSQLFVELEKNHYLVNSQLRRSLSDIKGYFGSKKMQKRLRAEQSNKEQQELQGSQPSSQQVSAEGTTDSNEDNTSKKPSLSTFAAKKSQMCIGVKNVVKCLESGELLAGMVCRSTQPADLTHELLIQAAAHTVPIVALPNLNQKIVECLGKMKSVIAIGFKKSDSCAFSSLVEAITKLAPPVVMPPEEHVQSTNDSTKTTSEEHVQPNVSGMEKHQYFPRAPKSGCYHDSHYDVLYPKDPFPHDEFSCPSRQNIDMRLPVLRPLIPHYHQGENLVRLPFGQPFSGPVFPLLPSPKDHLLPLDRPGLVNHFGEGLPPRAGLDSMRIGSVLVFPPKKTKFPLKATEAPSRTLYVGSLPRNTTKHHLKDLFSRYGQIDYLRISYNYAHIQFTEKTGLLRALDLDGAYIQVGPTKTPDDYGPIIVQFSIRHHDTELKNQEGNSTDEDSILIPYSATNAFSLPGLLYKDVKFKKAAKSLKAWFEQGHCTSSTANTFYSLLTSTNMCTYRAKKQLKEKVDELKKDIEKYKEVLDKVGQNCQAAIDVFQTASQQKFGDNFTKGQRKMVSQWADAAKDFLEEISAASDSSLSPGNFDDPPPAKTRKIDSDENGEVQALKQEAEQLKAETAVAVQERDDQILNLKTLLSKFKEECPSEWEILTEGKDIPQEEQGDSDSESGIEITEDDNSKTKGTSLAAAAAAYAQIRTTLGSVGQEGLGLTEPEVAIVSVLASFLAVHPLGATMNEITMYFQGFNPSYNSHYLESLLRRLSKVFQLSAGTEDLPGKWWFMGFQTCYSAVGEARPVGYEHY